MHGWCNTYQIIEFLVGCQLSIGSELAAFAQGAEYDIKTFSIKRGVSTHKRHMHNTNTIDI